MTPIVLEGPEVVQFSGADTERDARLLVAGEYPKKKLTVTEADLDSLVANFSGPVPVKVEHIDSPLDPLGLVQRVWREGAALMGRIAFPPEMAAFLSKRDAQKLSGGLLKEPVWRLLETSLTLTPHVPEATLLSDGEKAELVTLRQTVRAQRVEAQVAALKAAGKVIPATEPMARALLAADEGAVVTLSEGGPAVTLGEIFLKLLDAQQPLVRLGEIARPCHVGLALEDIVLRGDVTGALFEEEGRGGALDAVTDALNRRFGRGTVTTAAALVAQGYLDHGRIPFGRPRDMR